MGSPIGTGKSQKTKYQHLKDVESASKGAVVPEELKIPHYERDLEKYLSLFFTLMQYKNDPELYFTLQDVVNLNEVFGYKMHPVEVSVCKRLERVYLNKLIEIRNRESQ